MPTDLETHAKDLWHKLQENMQPAQAGVIMQLHVVLLIHTVLCNLFYIPLQVKMNETMCKVTLSLRFYLLCIVTVSQCNMDMLDKLIQ